jgi:hypothetical protein
MIVSIECQGGILHLTINTCDLYPITLGNLKGLDAIRHKAAVEVN